MAQLKFIHGAISGRLGELVGSSWKGINYIKTYSKPANPRTEGQISIRLVFRKISQWATALFKTGLLSLIPPARRMTPRNSVFAANKKMFTEKIFSAETLQVASANLPVSIFGLQCDHTGGRFLFQGGFAFAPNSPAVSAVAHGLVYDSVNGNIVAYANSPIADNIIINSEESSFGGNVSNEYLSEDVLSNCRFYVFISAVDTDNKLLLSETLSADVAIN